MSTDGCNLLFMQLRPRSIWDEGLHVKVSDILYVGFVFENI